MSAAEQDFIDAVELHSVEHIRAALDGGAPLQDPIRGKLPIDWLLEMYTRSDRFPACLRLLLERGATVADPDLLPVLLDDADGVQAAAAAAPSWLARRTTMVSAFTPLVGASLLHVAAEYGNLEAARALIDFGADVEARAAVDDHGLNGHTPIFHTVNSACNRSEPVMRLLLEAGADVGVRLDGVVWGAGFDWETTFFDVTPVSYTLLGLTPQMHRTESDTWANVRSLLRAAGRPLPRLDNVPNRYLAPEPG